MRNTKVLLCMVGFSLVLLGEGEKYGWAAAGTGATAAIQRNIDSNTVLIRVKGAEGPDVDKATVVAQLTALQFVAKLVTSDPRQKTKAAQYVEQNLNQVIGLSSPGVIKRQMWAGDNIQLKIMIRVDRRGLAAHLEEQGVVKSSRDTFKAIGKPRMLVFDGGTDCTRDGDGPICRFPKRIKEQEKVVERARVAIEQFFQKVVDAGCMAKTEVVQETESHNRDQSSGSRSRSSNSQASRSAESSGNYSRSGSSSGSASANRRSAAYSGRSRSSARSSGRSSSRARNSSSESDHAHVQIDRESGTRSYTSAVKASDNCKAFIRQMGPLDRRLEEAIQMLSDLEKELEGARKTKIKGDTNTVAANKWLLEQRWKILNADAIASAQKRLDAMSNLAGLPQDASAATALLAGADVFIKHRGRWNPVRGRGFQYILTLEAYLPDQAEAIASFDASSDFLANKDDYNASKMAIGRAMPNLIEQITTKWSDMVEDGVETKVVLEGDFSSGELEDIVDDMFTGLAEGDLRGCDEDVCSYDTESTGREFIVVFTSPVKTRKKFWRALRKALRREGIEYKKVVANKKLIKLSVY